MDSSPVGIRASTRCSSGLGVRRVTKRWAFPLCLLLQCPPWLILIDRSHFFPTGLFVRRCAHNTLGMNVTYGVFFGRDGRFGDLVLRSGVSAVLHHKHVRSPTFSLIPLLLHRVYFLPVRSPIRLHPVYHPSRLEQGPTTTTTPLERYRHCSRPYITYSQVSI